MWPENMAIVDAWMMVCSQWNTQTLATGAVLWHGLRYEGVKASLEMAEVTLTRPQWAGLRLMERVAASALNGYRG